jgi:chemotaxis protein methyltransferase CheR
MSFAAEFKLSRANCQFFAKLAAQVSSIRIDPAKEDFLQHRLSRRVRALGLEGFDAYVAMLCAEPTGPEINRFVEALTTHTTAFFRERHQYDWLAKDGIDMLAVIGAGTQRPAVIWSAACSTGAELWSAAMVFSEKAALPRGPRQFELVGTDISSRILKKAQNATYTEDEAIGISPVLLSKYFLRSKMQHAGMQGRLYRIVPELRSRARFLKANLLERDKLPQITADVVFLRNVLIYFEPEMQARAVDSVVERIASGGFLLTGHAEALAPHEALTCIGPSIYRKN